MELKTEKKWKFHGHLETVQKTLLLSSNIRFNAKTCCCHVLRGTCASRCHRNPWNSHENNQTKSHFSMWSAFGLGLGQMTECVAYSAAPSVTCKTSWNMEQTRVKWEPSQNTLPHLVQTQKSDIRGRREGETVWSCMATPPGKVSVLGSSCDRGAQRHWRAYLGSSLAMLEVMVSPGSPSSRGWVLHSVWSVMSWSCRKPTGQIQVYISKQHLHNTLIPET